MSGYIGVQLTSLTPRLSPLSFAFPTYHCIPSLSIFVVHLHTPSSHHMNAGNTQQLVADGSWSPKRCLGHKALNCTHPPTTVTSKESTQGHKHSTERRGVFFFSIIVIGFIPYCTQALTPDKVHRQFTNFPPSSKRFNYSALHSFHSIYDLLYPFHSNHFPSLVTLFFTLYLTPANKERAYCPFTRQRRSWDVIMARELVGCFAGVTVAAGERKVTSGESERVDERGG